MDIRVRYDPTADAAYIYLVDIRPGEAVRQVQAVEEQIILDFNCEDQLIGIEILSAERNLPLAILKMAER